MSNTPISSAIRMTPTMSTLTRTYRCHPCTSTLVIARDCDGMILFDRNKFSHWLVKDLATWTTRERGVNGWSWNNNGNVCWAFWCSLFRNAQLSIGFKVRRMIRRFIGVLKLGLGSINLERMTSDFLQLRKFRANHLGSNFRPGAEAQFIHHAVQTRQQRFVLQFQRPRPQL